jgi:hypothetical protein
MTIDILAAMYMKMLKVIQNLPPRNTNVQRYKGKSA